MRKVIAAVVFAGCVCATVAAAEFWETKPFMIWSAEEVQKVLNDSPWSRNVNVVLNTIGRAGSIAEGEGAGGRGGGGGGRGGGGDAGGESGRGGFPTRPPQLKLTVSWRSALPMKEALVRSQIGAGGAVPAEMQTLLEKADPLYVITIAGLPTRYARSLDGMKAETFLKRGNKPPIAVADMGAQEIAAAQNAPASLIVAFGFPRTDAIKLEDKDVEFVTKLGQFDIKKKFSLKDMIFHGQLEL